MTYQRLAYEDAATTTEMASDCVQAEHNLALPGQRGSAVETADSALFEGYPDAPRPVVVVSDALAEMAAGLHLHFD